MKIECILDSCPVDGEMVDHRRCCRCEHNPLGDEQPEVGWQECIHPDVRRDPSPKRWEDLKSAGSEILSVTLAGKLRGGRSK